MDLDRDRADEAVSGGGGGKHAHQIGPALDLAIQPFDRGHWDQTCAKGASRKSAKVVMSALACRAAKLAGQDRDGRVDEAAVGGEDNQLASGRLTGE